MKLTADPIASRNQQILKEFPFGPWSAFKMGMRPVMKSIERRAKVRFPVERELRYKLVDGETLIGSGTGTTCDMSSSGIAFQTDHPLRTGAFIELSISWPAQLDNGCPMRLVVFGKVVRSGVNRSACTVERHEFRTQGRMLQFTAPARVDGMLLRWTREFSRLKQQAQATA